MKKILFILICLISAVSGYSQFINQSGAGSNTTLNFFRGGLTADSMFQIKNSYVDTSAANFSVAKHYMGSLIRIGNVLWMRGSSLGGITPNRWYEFAITSSTGTVTSISQGIGIINTPNPITTTGTIQSDTLAISTKANVQKVKDSLLGLLGNGYVPYIGANANVDLGAFRLAASTTSDSALKGTATTGAGVVGVATNANGIGGLFRAVSGTGAAVRAVNVGLGNLFEGSDGSNDVFIVDGYGTIYAEAADITNEIASINHRFRNSGFSGNLLTTTLTGNQTYTLQNASGTLAFLGDTSSGNTNKFVRLQTGNLFRQDGKMWISDTIRTSGYVYAQNLYSVTANAIPSVTGVNSSTGRGGSFSAQSGIGVAVQNNSSTNPALKVIQNNTAAVAQFYNNFDLGVSIDTSADITISNLRSAGFVGKVQLPTITANRNFVLPNASGTLALTSNVTDSSSALRASINTKLNISDTAAMLNGNYLRLTGGTLTGALNGTSATFSGLVKVTGGTIVSGSELSFAWNGSTGGSIQSFSSLPLALNPSGNAVGIGTASPNIISGTGLDINSGLAATVSSLNISTGGTRRISLYSDNSGSELKTATAIPLTLGVNGGDDFRISSGNRILFKTTIDNGVNDIQIDGDVYTSSLGTGAVYSNAGVLTNADPSDVRIKNSIKPHKYGLSEILKLQPKSFYYNTDSAKASLKYGFIAQDVKQIMPDMVRTVTGDTLGLESQGIYVTMVKAIQEQQAIIDQIRKELNEAKATINQLKSIAGEARLRKTRR